MTSVIGTRIKFLENCGHALKGEIHTFYDPVLVSQLIVDGKVELVNMSKLAGLSEAEAKVVHEKLVTVISRKGE